MAYVWPFRFSRWLEALVNAKGGSVLNDIDPNVKAVAIIMEGNEDRYLQGWNRFGISQSITGGPSASAGIELHNPLGSNVVGVVEQLNGSAAVVTSSSFSLTLTPGPNAFGDLGVVQALKMDGRSNQNSALIYSTSTSTVGFANRIALGRVNNGGVYQFIQTVNQEIVLMPGSGLILVDLTLAEAASFDIQWRERALQQSELT